MVSPGSAAAAPGELFSPQAVAFERFDAENLLPQSSVYDLRERSDLYLWLVTLDGLVRFDGVRRKVFDRTEHPGLETTRLTALWDDPDSGALWLGTEDGRLALFREGRFTTFASTDPALGPVTALRRGQNGRIFVFYHHGAETVELGEGGLRRVGAVLAGESFYPCGAGLFGADGNLWQVGDQGFFSVALPPELAGAAVRASCQSDAGGGLWLRSPGGLLWRVQGEKLARDARENLLPPAAIPFAEDAAGNLWLKLAEAPRLGRLDREGRLLRYGEGAGVDPKGQVIRAYFDREGGLWIGSTTALYRYLGEAIRGLSLRHAGGEVEVATHYEAADGSAFVATRDLRFWRLGADGELAELTTRDTQGRLLLRPELTAAAAAEPGDGSVEAPVEGPATYQAYVETGGDLWVGTDSGLLRWRRGRILFFRSARFVPGALAIAGGINDLLPEGGGLWLATTEGVARFEGERVVRVWGPPDGVAAGVLTLLRDRRGILWAGTRAGLLRFDGERFAPVAGLGPEIGQARVLHEDDSGKLWVGTYDQGLFRRLPDGRVQHASPQQGFPESGVFTIHIDGRGFLWTTSNRGLLRSRLADVDRLLAAGSGRVPAVLYGRSAGLPSSECNGGFRAAGYVCRGGAWCVQTLGGIAVARLAEARVVELAPAPVIEEARVDGAVRSIEGGTLRLSPVDRNVSLRFSGIAFEGAHQLEFRYRLGGYDSGWVETGGRSEAFFGDLPPGDYQLEVLAESREGVVSPRPARLAIVVEPAWWERGSIRSLALLLTIGLIWTMVRFRLRLLSRRHARSELVLRAAAEELELRVRERTAELDAEVAERRRAEEEARSASAAKSAFLAQMSHELRTPMNAIIGLSEMLVRTPLSPQQHEWVSTVCSSGDALMSIIEDILDFSRIEAGRMEVEARAFDPAVVVSEAVRIVGTLAAAKGLLIGWSHGPGVPAQVVGDAPRLRQVLLNLLGNAIKFTERGSIEVYLGATPGADGWLLEMAVKDSGIGIAPEAQIRVFEPFTQADASMSRRFGGSGLGLAICQRVIAALGGRLRLESRPGEGSTFTIECPVARAPAGGGAEASPAPGGGAVGGADFSGLRVLVAEDDQVNQLVSRSLLQALGIFPEVVESGEQVLARMTGGDSGETFEVVLMDLHLPGQSGLEASRRLRAELPAERQPYLIALTAAVTPEDRADCQAAGMNDFLAKPIREQDLRTALERAARWWRIRRREI